MFPSNAYLHTSTAGMQPSVPPRHGKHTSSPAYPLAIHLSPSASGIISPNSATSPLIFSDPPVANHTYPPTHVSSAISTSTKHPSRYLAHGQLYTSPRNNVQAGPLMAWMPTMLAPPLNTAAATNFSYRQQAQREMPQPSTGSQQPLNIHKSQPKRTFNKPQKTYFTSCHNVSANLQQPLPSALLS